MAQFERLSAQLLPALLQLAPGVHNISFFDCSLNNEHVLEAFVACVSRLQDTEHFNIDNLRFPLHSQRLQTGRRRSGNHQPLSHQISSRTRHSAVLLAMAVAKMCLRTATLRGLCLSGCSLDDKAVSAIASSLPTSLLTLNLSDNAITAEGVQDLALGLPKCRVLQTLNLSVNPLGDRGLLALVPALLDLRTLHHLSLEQTEISFDGAQQLLALVPGSADVPTDASRNLWLVELALDFNNEPDAKGRRVHDAVHARQREAQGCRTTIYCELETEDDSGPRTDTERQ